MSDPLKLAKALAPIARRDLVKGKCGRKSPACLCASAHVEALADLGLVEAGPAGAWFHTELGSKVASAIEAATAAETTEIGSVHESAVPKADAQGIDRD